MASMGRTLRPWGLHIDMLNHVNPRMFSPFEGLFRTAAAASGTAIATRFPGRVTSSYSRRYTAD